MQRVAHGLFEAAGAGRTVLAPNAELAAALQGAVERMHLAAGDGIWPTPKIRDFGGWLREQHARRQLSDAALPRVLGEVEERELWRSVIEDSGFGEVFLEPAGAARAARRARQAMATTASRCGRLRATPPRNRSRCSIGISASSSVAAS